MTTVTRLRALPSPQDRLPELRGVTRCLAIRGFPAGPAARRAGGGDPACRRRRPLRRRLPGPLRRRPARRGDHPDDPWSAGRHPRGAGGTAGDALVGAGTVLSQPTCRRSQRPVRSSPSARCSTTAPSRPRAGWACPSCRRSHADRDRRRVAGRLRVRQGLPDRPRGGPATCGRSGRSCPASRCCPPAASSPPVSGPTWRPAPSRSVSAGRSWATHYDRRGPAGAQRAAAAVVEAARAVPAPGHVGGGRDGVTGLVTLGETMAALSAPTVGPLRHQPHLHLHVGGAESNVAIAVARLGGAAAWVGRVGDDELGDLVLAQLRGEGVDVRDAVRDPGAPTGLMVKSRRTPAVGRVAYYRAAPRATRCPRRPAGRPAALGAVLHVTGITPALSATARAATFAAVEEARGRRRAGQPRREPPGGALGRRGGRPGARRAGRPCRRPVRRGGRGRAPLPPGVGASDPYRSWPRVGALGPPKSSSSGGPGGPWRSRRRCGRRAPPHVLWPSTRWAPATRSWAATSSSCAGAGLRAAPRDGRRLRCLRGDRAGRLGGPARAARPRAARRARRDRRP